MPYSRKSKNKENLLSRTSVAPLASSTIKPSSSLEPTEILPIKKTRKRKTTDGGWSKKSEKPAKSAKVAKPNGRGILGSRADQANTITDEQGNKREAKSAVVFDKKIVEDLTGLASPAAVKKELAKSVKEIKGSCEVGDMIYKDDELIAVTTPLTKTILYRREIMYDGLYTLFSEKMTSPASPEYTPVKEIHPSVFKSSPFAAVKKHKATKPQEIEITPELLARAEKEIQANNGRRVMSQNKVVAAEGVSEKKSGATRYAGATGEFPAELKWEWLHFIAHKILASHSQAADNLGCGTFHANTDMMFVEYQIPHLAKAYPKGFYLKVEPEFIENSFLLKKINYTIATDDFKLAFVFNPQKFKRPDYLNLAYTGALVATAIKLKNGRELSPSKPSDQYEKNHLFYSPIPIKKSKEKSETPSSVEKVLNFDEDMDVCSPIASRTRKSS